MFGESKNIRHIRLIRLTKSVLCLRRVTIEDI